MSSEPKLIREILLKRRTIHSNDRFDPNFKRMCYIRYADDFFILVTGTIHEATHINNNIKGFLSSGLKFYSVNTNITNIAETKKVMYGNR